MKENKLDMISYNGDGRHYNMFSIIAEVLKFINNNNLMNTTRNMFLGSEPSEQVILYELINRSIEMGYPFDDSCIQWSLTER